MQEELKNTIPICPECGSETYTTPADTDYYNIWCCDPKQECEWFTEVDIPCTLADAQREIDAQGLEHFDPTVDIV